MAASLAIAPVVVALIAIGADRRSAFHCLLIRTSASRGLHVELCADELDVTVAGLETLLCNGRQLRPGEWIGLRTGATHPGKIARDITYYGRFPLLATYRGGPSFLWVGVSLSGLMIPSLLVWLVVLGRWLRTRRNRLRIEQGLCPACGYDLRASPTRCPECGAEAIPTVLALPDRPAA